MAYETITDLSADTTISLGGVNKKTGKPNPKEIEGYYLGNKQVEDKKKKSGVSYIYIFQTAKGNVGVWGKTDLDRKMQSAVIGAMVKATHVGFTSTPNGDMYKYDVKQDKSNTIEVSEPSVSSQLAQAYADDTYEQQAAPKYDDEDDYSQEDMEDGAQETALVAAADAALRKAKVAALLGKNKKA